MDDVEVLVGCRKTGAEAGSQGGDALLAHVHALTQQDLQLLSVFRWNVVGDSSALLLEQLLPVIRGYY